GPGGGAGRLGGRKIGHVQAGPALAVPEDIAAEDAAVARIALGQPRLLWPGIALQIGGGAVVEDAAIGRPREAPAGRDPAVAVAVGGVVVAAGEDPGVDPRAARRAAVVFDLVERVQRPTAGPVVAVDLTEHALGGGIVLDAPLAI